MFRGYIYLIYNEVNNELYVGMTERTIEDRFYQHKMSVKHGNYGNCNLLYPNMKKVGVLECKITCLEVYEYDGEDKDYFRTNLRKLEDKWMTRLKPSLNVMTPYPNEEFKDNVKQFIQTNKSKKIDKFNKIIQANMEKITNPSLEHFKFKRCDYEVILSYSYSNISYKHKSTGDRISFKVGDIVRIDHWMKSPDFTEFSIITNIRSNSIVCTQIKKDGCVNNCSNYIMFKDFIQNVKNRISSLDENTGNEDK